ncbi:MAG: sigma-54 interaction domain-containing protein [Desulfurella sp.]|uniref:sigma-54 interaction domain-containing protein n=1 Tax=Desulfurella sp. TaxID=1962857 RepID=UPI003D0D51CC
MKQEDFSFKTLQAITDNLYIGIYVTDGSGKAIYINKTFEDISLLKKEDLLGHDINELVKKKYFTASATVLTLNTKQPSVVTYITKAGKKLLSRAKPVFGNNKELTLIVNSVYDVTEFDYKGELDFDSKINIDGFQQFIAYDKKMLEILDFVSHIALVDSTVLITGETGTGKEVLAKLIHSLSKRKNKPFIKVNCAAIPENLIETELFGYEPGAFTGASPRGKKGFFEIANNSTLFLDEIGELPLNTQAKLLQVLQDKKFTKVGSPKLIEVDVRIIAATNRKLEEMMEKNLFRQDLYYRLNVIPIDLPPLRERLDDIEPISTYIVQRMNNKYGFEKTLSRELIEFFKLLPWKGNIRELENVIEKLLVVVPRKEITKEDFLKLEQTKKSEINPKQLISDCEKEVLLKLLSSSKSMRDMANKLGVSKATVIRKLKQYNISVHK